MLRFSLALFAFLTAGSIASFLPAKEPPPNILIISIDDLNDWTGCLGGHPQAKTPNIDRLATQGTLFRNAHCQAPICTCSRASLVSGLFPSTTGLYFLQPPIEASKVAMAKPHLLRQFSKAGYHTMGAGKFVHGQGDGKHYDEYGGGMGGFGPLPKKKLSQLDGHKLWDWGAYPESEEETPDAKIADWVIEKLNAKREKPFVLVAGFWRPHVPMYAPQKWLDQFPLESIQLPKTKAKDRDDISAYAKQLTIGLPAPRHEWFVERNAWKEAVQAYLASVAFVDDQVGRVLAGLKASPHAKNTIVVLLSDHGWHLGEKERWAKRSLWNDGIRVPLIITAPGYAEKQICDAPVGLIDIFPTLLELSNQPPRTDLEGLSLKRLLTNPDAEWSRPILTTFGPENHSLRARNWHYIRYADGSEELYHHANDPHEWTNIADQKPAIIAEFRKHLPKTNAAPLIGPNRNWEVEAWREAEKLRKTEG